jgi:hypothetical protein
MRALVAAALAAFLVAAALAPHVHHGSLGDHDCAACLARNAESPRSEVPDLARGAAGRRPRAVTSSERIGPAAESRRARRLQVRAPVPSWARHARRR